ncbi:MAG: glycosyltransferase [Proteobacteria bacterium]|nr:glycosyltransferase [Pseudomonadota bacterium]
MVITEALAAGIPVIVPREAGAAELIQHGEGGFLMDQWDNVNQLAGFLRMLEDDVLRDAMGKKARLTAESRTWDDVANETLAVYYSTLKR